MWQVVQLATCSDPLPSQEINDFTYFNLLLFGKMITGKLSLKSLGGPITIFETAGEALNAGYLSFIFFTFFKHFNWCH